MTLRPEFTLGHSEYNAFLFASVGEEAVGVQLTVLTALTRLGLDPWQEAARLSDLPREAAAWALAATIATLPAGDWKVSESGAIAARLVDCLPARSAPAVPSFAAGSRKAGPLEGEKMKPGRERWLMWGAIFVVVLSLTLYLQPDNNLEPSSGTGVSTQR
ncbi:MAG: hypothetical protein HYZ40_19375 [Rhodospirillales bacterium]|nr:hypothetical protein [Rhodospirillales bacterium]